jgi:hypothetical protein
VRSRLAASIERRGSVRGKRRPQDGLEQQPRAGVPTPGADDRRGANRVPPEPGPGKPLRCSHIRELVFPDHALVAVKPALHLILEKAASSLRQQANNGEAFLWSGCCLARIGRKPDRLAERELVCWHQSSARRVQAAGPRAEALKPQGRPSPRHSDREPRAAREP